MANPFLVLGGIAVGVVVATFGVLQVPGWVASAQDAAAINDLSNLNQAQAAFQASGGTFTADITALSGNAEAGGLDLSAPVTTLAMSDLPLATAKDGGATFRLSTGVELKHLDTNGEGSAYCAVVQSATGRYFASSEGGKISSDEATVQDAMDSAGCKLEARGDFLGGKLVYEIGPYSAHCKTAVFNFGGAVDASIDWGDGTRSAAGAGQNRHDYAAGTGYYTITITGTVPEIHGSVLAQAQCFKGVPVWTEGVGTVDASGMFQYAKRMTEVAPLPSTVKNTSMMFADNSALLRDVKNWDMSNVENLSRMFSKSTQFNEDVSHWNVSHATDVSEMFGGATLFDQDLSKWDVSKVTAGGDKGTFGVGSKLTPERMPAFPRD